MPSKLTLCGEKRLGYCTANGEEKIVELTQHSTLYTLYANSVPLW
jgi:hypothetical protein